MNISHFRKTENKQKKQHWSFFSHTQRYKAYVLPWKSLADCLSPCVPPHPGEFTVSMTWPLALWVRTLVLVSPWKPRHNLINQTQRGPMDSIRTIRNNNHMGWNGLFHSQILFQDANLQKVEGKRSTDFKNPIYCLSSNPDSVSHCGVDWTRRWTSLSLHFLTSRGRILKLSPKILCGVNEMMSLKQLVQVILIVSAFALAGMDKVDAADWMQ